MLNVCVFEGVLAHDVFSKKVGNRLLAQFSIWNRQKFTSPANGQTLSRNTLIYCEAWDHHAQYLCRNGRKGDHVRVYGRLNMTKWKDEAGVERCRMVVYSLDVRIAVKAAYAPADAPAGVYPELDKTLGWSDEAEAEPAVDGGMPA